VGYNPYRRFKAKPADYVLVAVCLAIAVALLIWALAG
jgi:energy-coupling factor transporter transmembrane protein EcfT